MKKIVSVLLIVCLIILSTCACSLTPTEIGYQDFITVEYSGFNGYGTPSMTIDKDGLNSLVDAKKVTDFVMKNSKSAKEEKEDIEALRSAFGIEETEDDSLFYFTDLVDFKFEKEYKNLKNDDDVDIAPCETELLEDCGKSLDEMLEALNLKMPPSVVYLVRDLKEGTVIDLFKDVEKTITYTGASGKGIANFEVPEDYSTQVENIYIKRGAFTNSYQVIADNQKIGEYTVYLDNPNNETYIHNGTVEKLKTGDKIRVYTTIPDGLQTYCDSHNMIIDSSEKTITVPDIGNYINLDELSATDIANAKTELTNYIKENSNTATVKGFYKATIKPDGVNKLTDSSPTIFVVATTPGFFFTNVYAYYIKGIIQNADKTIKYDFASKQIYTSSNDSISVLNSFSNQFNYEILN